VVKWVNPKTAPTCPGCSHRQSRNPPVGEGAANSSCVIRRLPTSATTSTGPSPPRLLPLGRDPQGRVPVAEPLKERTTGPEPRPRVYLSKYIGDWQATKRLHSGPWSPSGCLSATLTIWSSRTGRAWQQNCPRSVRERSPGQLIEIARRRLQVLVARHTTTPPGRQHCPRPVSADKRTKRQKDKKALPQRTPSRVLHQRPHL